MTFAPVAHWLGFVRDAVRGCCCDDGTDAASMRSDSDNQSPVTSGDSYESFLVPVHHAAMPPPELVPVLSKQQTQSKVSPVPNYFAVVRR